MLIDVLVHAAFLCIWPVIIACQHVIYWLSRRSLTHLTSAEEATQLDDNLTKTEIKKTHTSCMHTTFLIISQFRI